MSFNIFDAVKVTLLPTLVIKQVLFWGESVSSIGKAFSGLNVKQDTVVLLVKWP